MQDAENFGLPFGLLEECKKEADKRYRKMIPALFDKFEEYALALLAKALQAKDSAKEADSLQAPIEPLPQEAPCIQEQEEINYERRERE